MNMMNWCITLPSFLETRISCSLGCHPTLCKVVNGQKTFISGGMHADYFTTGVRTSGKAGSQAPWYP